MSYDPDGFGPLPQPAPGKVYLLAPTGTIDAGEAGVSSASGLVVAALVVKNGDNFSASGSSVGVPSVSAAPAAPVSGDAAASASKAMDAVTQAGNALASAKDADLKSFRPAFVSVEVLGFGGGLRRMRQGRRCLPQAEKWRHVIVPRPDRLPGHEPFGLCPGNLIS